MFPVRLRGWSPRYNKNNPEPERAFSGTNRTEKMQNQSFNAIISEAENIADENRTKLKEAASEMREISRCVSSLYKDEDDQETQIDRNYAISILCELKRHEAMLIGFRTTLDNFYKLSQTTQETVTA